MKINNYLLIMASGLLLVANSYAMDPRTLAEFTKDIQNGIRRIEQDKNLKDTDMKSLAQQIETKINRISVIEPTKAAAFRASLKAAVSEKKNMILSAEIAEYSKLVNASDSDIKTQLIKTKTELADLQAAIGISQEEKIKGTKLLQDQIQRLEAEKKNLEAQLAEIKKVPGQVLTDTERDKKIAELEKLLQEEKEKNPVYAIDWLDKQLKELSAELEKRDGRSLYADDFYKPYAEFMMYANKALRGTDPIVQNEQQQERILNSINAFQKKYFQKRAAALTKEINDLKAVIKKMEASSLLSDAPMQQIEDLQQFITDLATAKKIIDKEKDSYITTIKDELLTTLNTAKNSALGALITAEADKIAKSKTDYEVGIKAKKIPPQVNFKAFVEAMNKLKPIVEKYKNDKNKAETQFADLEEIITRFEQRYVKNLFQIVSGVITKTATDKAVFKKTEKAKKDVTFRDLITVEDKVILSGVVKANLKILSGLVNDISAAIDALKIDLDTNIPKEFIASVKNSIKDFINESLITPLDINWITPLVTRLAQEIDKTEKTALQSAALEFIDGPYSKIINLGITTGALSDITMSNITDLQKAVKDAYEKTQTKP